MPFLYVHKTMEDHLMDVLLHIPELLESIMTPHLQTLDKGNLLGKIHCHQLELNHWRNEWLKLNPNSATSIPICHSSQSLSPFLAFYLSSGLKTNTTQQAKELICYHSAMLLFGQLKSLLDGHSPKEDIITSISIHEALNPSDLLPKEVSSLLLPDKIKLPWQHGLEGLRILAGFGRELFSDHEFYLVFAPLGILYCFSEYLGIQQMMISMISREDWAGDAEHELGPYRLYGFDVSSMGLRVNEPCNPAEEEYSGDRPFATKRLFINSSWP